MRQLSIVFVAIIAAMALSAPAYASQKETAGINLRLPAVFGDGMVIQRDAPINIWGWAEAGSRVTVTLNGKSRKAKTGKNGKWSMVLPDMAAGGPYALTVSSGGNSLTLNDVMIGDVFLFSGQSNQELQVYRCMDNKTVAEAVAGYTNNNVRILKLPQQFNYVSPQDDCQGGQWTRITPQTAGGIAAVSYFVAREIQEYAGVPIGIINSSVGGTGVECWMSQENLKQFPEYKDKFSHDKYHQTDWVEQRRKKETAKANIWEKEITEADTVMHRWRNDGYDFSAWKPVDLFSAFYNKEKPNGNYWFRKTFTLSADDIKQAKQSGQRDGLLRLGAMKDADSVYVNGVFVGNTTYQYPPRKYPVPLDVLREGENDIVIHLNAQFRTPHFIKDKLYQLELPSRTIPLTDKANPWRMAIGALMRPRPTQTYFVGTPTGLYNAMIHPLGPICIRGMVWYQGEANEWNPKNYATYLAAMINEWKQQFPTLPSVKQEQGSWPSVIVQLAGYMNRHIGAYDSGWCGIRSQQRLLTMLPDSLSVNASLATAIDCGEWNDIHPQDKATISHRIALQLMRHAYGENIVSEGPSPIRCIENGGKLIVTFSPETGRLRPFDDGIAHVTGDYELTIDIHAMQTMLSSTYSLADGMLRYAHDDFPLCTIYNTNGIASPQFEIKIEQ